MAIKYQRIEVFKFDIEETNFYVFLNGKGVCLCTVAHDWLIFECPLEIISTKIQVFKF